MRSTRLLFAATAILMVSLALGAAQAVAQEIPQPITRPCKHPCLNKIRLNPAPRLDTLELHARIIPLTDIDPGGETFTVELTDVNGTIFSATLPPGALLTTNGGKRYSYRNAAARTVGGLYRVQIQKRKDANEGYRVDILAYGDLSAATVPDIATFIAVGNDGFFDNSMWMQRHDGWAVDFLP